MKDADPGEAALAGQRRLRIALSRRAYDQRVVRLTGADIGGCTHLVSTRRGLFAVDRQACRLVAHGLFFGLTMHGGDFLAFEACDEPRSTSPRGRIVRLIVNGGRIGAASVFAEGLDNGCHRIDMIDDTLFIADTYRQRIVAIGPNGCARDIDPLTDDGAEGYAHINSLIASGDKRLILLHNGGDSSGRASEVAVLDADWRLLGRHRLAGTGCHDFAILEDGALLSCGSFAGELIGSDGFRLKVTELMTRGLSVGRDEIVIGGSPFSERDLRSDLTGAVYFIDRRDMQVRSTVALPSPPMDILRIDGIDLSLSHYVRQRGHAAKLPPIG